MVENIKKKKKLKVLNKCIEVYLFAYLGNKICAYDVIYKKSANEQVECAYKCVSVCVGRTLFSDCSLMIST